MKPVQPIPALTLLLSFVFFCGDAFAQSKLQGLCFSAHRDGESPALLINPLPSTVRKDVAFASRVATTIRTYSVQGSSYLIPEFCDEFGVNCVVGAWIGKAEWQNEAQLELLIRLANSGNRRITSVIVGNEVLHRGDCSSEQMIAYIRRVKKACNVPVGVAETWKAWVDHPEVAREVDFLAIQAYPYWEGMPIDGAAEYTVKRVLEIQRKHPDKKVMLSEFGWPTGGKSKGQAIASPENAARYLREILPLLDKNKIEYYYFSLWDEKWKVGAEGGVGAYWGLYNSDGTVKPIFKDVVPQSAVKGSERPKRTVTFQLAADEYRNASVVRVAYPPAQPEKQTAGQAAGGDAPSPERGPGLQVVVGSGVRMDFPRDSNKTAKEPVKQDPPKQTANQPDTKRPNVETTTTDHSAPKVFTKADLDVRFKRPAKGNELYGLCLSLFRDNETPHQGIVPLVSELEADIRGAKALTGFVRTYSVTQSFSLVPDLCEKVGVDCMPGAALGKYPWLNDAEIEMLIRVGRSGNPRVKAVIVGNEVMHRNDFSVEQYIDYIRRVKQSVKVPVATAELLHTWLEHPELADEVDILGVQIYPFWGGLRIDDAAQDTLANVKRLQAAHPNKRVILTEFGWPTAGGKIGGADATPENAARYFRETIPLLNENGIEYFYFAMTDEKWKAGDEGGPGAHWGLLESTGEVKKLFKPLLPETAGMKRPARTLNP